MEGLNVLTHSRMACAKTCLRKHYFAYELGVRRERTSQPLRMGAAVHLGLDLKAQGHTAEESTAAAVADYAIVPDWATPEEWMTEREIVTQLLMAYFAYYQNDDFEIVATEQAFNISLLNPETGSPAKTFTLAGKIDKIIRLSDERLAVMEHKTTGDSLSPDSDYWPRLRLDQQLSLYVSAARALGHDVSTVLYDVIGKPGIRPCQIAQTDALGKIVLDPAGARVFKKDGSPRESSDSAKGYKLQTRLETADEYGARLAADICAQPERYFARKEIARLDSDLAEFQQELWDQQKTLLACRAHGRWYRNTGACLHPFKCEYCDLCFSGANPEIEIPQGYIKVENVHQELG